MNEEVTQADLEDWGRDIFRRIDERFDVVFKQLSLGEQHTIAMMAAQFFATNSTITFDTAAQWAKKLYRCTQKTLETDRTIQEGACQQLTGH